MFRFSKFVPVSRTINLSFGLSLLGCTACFGQQTPSVQPLVDRALQALPISTSPVGKRIPNSTNPEAVFVALTSQVWTNRHPDFKHPFGLCPVGEGDSEYRFFPNGLYEHRWIPLAGGEPIVKAQWRWDLQRSSVGHWFVCLDNGERHPVSLFEQGAIYLDGYKYPKSSVKLERPLPKAENMAAIRLPNEVKRRNNILCSRVWHRANDVNLDRYPARIEFRKDFTYVAEAASGRSYPVGTWYATAESVVADGPEDVQGESAYLRDYGAYLPITIANENRLIIDDTPYLPSEQIDSKGTILHFGSRGDALRILVEYELPIRQGKPCRFHFQFLASADMTLQRISLTRDYDHGYRLPDGSLAVVDELAAVDLKNATLAASEARSFVMEVIFPEAGDQPYYLNAMVQGAAQSWDAREAFTFRVQSAE